MESKNIKVVDEHGIDRNANVMFAFDLGGSEYVTYWISRDEENNNVFVSKLLKNIDGTSSMLNIDDADEKDRVSLVVKTLITNSVEDQNDKVNNNEITMSDGRIVKLCSVLFNKEQYINVQRTYITTVKKNVTLVVEKYYNLVDTVKSEAVVPASVTPSVVESSGVNTENVAVVPEVNVAPVMEPVVQQPVVTATPAVSEPVVAPVVPTPVVAVSEAPMNVVSNVAVVPQQVLVETPVQPTVNQGSVGEVVEPITVASVLPVQPVSAVSAPTPVAPAPVVTPVVAPVVQQSVVTETPVVSEPTVTVQTTSASEENKLVFDASKESNLNAALGEVAGDKALSVENLSSIREFGEDIPHENVNTQAISPMVQPEAATESKVLTKKAGFANNKFFMVVAIAFFLASCVFLGYEVFNYFQIAK